MDTEDAFTILEVAKMFDLGPINNFINRLKRKCFTVLKIATYWYPIGDENQNQPVILVLPKSVEYIRMKILNNVYDLATL